MIQRMLRRLILVHVLLILSIAVPLLVYAGEIVVKPGKFDHFNISMPERLVAGEEATIRLQAVDAFNNTISNFGETDREFHIAVTGSAAVNPPSFKASSFSGGAMTITLSDKTAETFTLSIRESGSPIPIVSKDLSIVPNKLSSFVLKGPRTALAGEVFDIRIIAKDAYGNTVTEPISGKNLNLIFKGGADPKIDTPAIPDFKGGVSVVSLVSHKSGTTQIEAKDLITGSMGTSDKIDIISGPVSSFKIFAPKDVIAGEPFELAIVAVDRFNNVVANYAKTGGGVAITSSGKLKPFPATIPAYEFVNGQAKVDLRYDVAEDISLTVSEIGKAPKGTTETIRVVSPIPERYEVTTPESVVAGQKFKLKITVYNQLGHVIKNYNLVGPDVQLSTTGTGALIPNRIPASEFVNGTTVVEVQYNKSEAFAIYASPIKGTAGTAATAPSHAAAPFHAAKKAAPAPEKQQAKAAAKQAKKSKKAKAKEGAKKGKEAKAKRRREITNLSIVESKKKSVITIHIPNADGTLKYAATAETIEGKKWVVLKITPTTSKVEKTLKFDSSFVGDVVIEDNESEKGTVTIKIELLKAARFHVTKDKNSLSVTLR